MIFVFFFPEFVGDHLSTQFGCKWCKETSICVISPLIWLREPKSVEKPMEEVKCKALSVEIVLSFEQRDSIEIDFPLFLTFIG
jgi:hypothetical protein